MITIAQAIRNGAHDREMIAIENAIADRAAFMYGMAGTSYRPCPRAGCTMAVAPNDDHYHCGRCSSPAVTNGYGCPGACR